MKKQIFIAAAFLGLSVTAAFADEWVNGYTRRDGTQVQGYYRTSPDGNPYNNYSTQGNTNPYTGQPGYVNPYAQPLSPYGSPYGGQPYVRGNTGAGGF